LASLTVRERTASEELNKKRSREPEGPESFNLLSPSSDLSLSSSPSGTMSSKGGEKARRLSSNLAPEFAGSSNLPDLNFTLPMYTAELGSLDFPVYGQFHFTDPIQTGSASAVFSSSTGTTEPDPRLPGTATPNVNLDSLMFDHLTPEAVEAAAIPQIPPTANAYVIDALFHGHGQPQPQTQSTFSMTGSSQELDMDMVSESHLDFRSGGLDMSSFGIDFADFSEFAGASSDDMSMLESNHDQDGRSSGYRMLSGLNNETIVLWDELPFNT